MEQETRRDSITMLQLTTTVAVVLFAMLMVTVDHPIRIGGFRLLPTLIGITGLAFTAIGLIEMDTFRENWQRTHPADEDLNHVQAADLLPLLFEIGLWALGLLYVVRLAEIARG